MRTKKDYHLYVLIVIQTLLLLYTFHHIIFNADQYIFCNAYDGIRNYFTYKTFVEPGLHKDLMFFHDMNYPYGDYIFFTDNTPLFAVLYKLFCLYIVDISAHSIYIFNLFCLAGILISTILSYKILSKFVSEKIILYTYSILLPWLNPQSMRLFIGHFNLSFSWVILLVIYLLILIYEKDWQQKSYRKELIWLFITVYCSSFLHLYYFAITLVMAGTFFACLFIYKLIKKEKIIYYMINTGLCMIMSFITVILTIKSVDSYASLRKAGAGGYNWIAWKLNIPALFTAYGHIKSKFLFSSTQEIPYESYSYLGTATLFFLLFVFVWLLFRRNRIELKENMLQKKEYISLYFLLIIAAISFFISIGPYYSFMNDEYLITNYFNPFYYIEKITETVTQFRCLGRFIWPFFWIINLSAAVFLSYFFKKNNYYKLILVGVIIFSFTDLKDIVTNYKGSKQSNYFSEKNYSPELHELKKDIPFQQYQAILTIPFYHSGSEIAGYIIDPDDYFAITSMQLADLSGLPLMPAKLGRTPLNHAQSFIEMFVNGSIGPELKNKLNSKPILILVKRSFYDGRENWPQISAEPAITAFKNGLDFLAKNNCIKIKETESFELYRLDVK
jgi:hypothetical protein